MATSIGTMSAKITADASGLKAVTDKARADIAGLAGSTGGSGGGFGALLNIGRQFAGPLAGLASIGGAMATLKGMIADADKITNIADQIDVGTEALQAMTISAERAGLSMETVATGVTKLQKTIAGAYSGSKEAAGALKELGLSADDLIGMSPDKAFEAVAVALEKVHSPAIRTRLEMDLLGKSGAQLRTVLRETAKGLEAYGSMIVSNRAIRAIDEAGDAAEDAWRAVKATMTEVVGQTLYAVGFGERERSQAEITRLAEQEAAARRDGARAMEMQAEAAKRTADLDRLAIDQQKLLDTLRGMPFKGDQYQQSLAQAQEFADKEERLRREGAADDLAIARQTAQQKYLAEIEAAEQRAKEIKDLNSGLIGGTGAWLDKTFGDWEVPNPEEEMARGVARARQELFTSLNEAAAQYKAHLADAGAAHDEYTGKIREAAEHSREMMEAQEKSRRHTEEAAAAQREAQSAVAATATAAERYAEAQRKATEWLRAGAITAEQYDKLVGKAAADMAKAQPKQELAGLERGTAAEYEERVRLMDQRDTQAQQVHDQQLQVQREGFDELRGIRRSLDRMLDNSPKTYVAFDPH